MSFFALASDDASSALWLVVIFAIAPVVGVILAAGIVRFASGKR